jgi:hypothetical protein
VSINQILTLTKDTQLAMKRSREPTIPIIRGQGVKGRRVADFKVTCRISPEFNYLSSGDPDNANVSK